MKFIDWYNFNFVDNKVINVGDIYVKCFRKKSYSADDVMFDAKMRVEDANNLFGDYNLMMVKIRSDENDFARLCALIYKEDN